MRKAGQHVKAVCMQSAFEKRLEKLAAQKELKKAWKEKHNGK